MANELNNNSKEQQRSDAMQTYEIIIVQDSSIIMIYNGGELVKSMEILSNLQSVLPADVEIVVTTYEQDKPMFVNKTNGRRD